MQLMTINEAARHLGYKTRSHLYVLINNGYLKVHVHVQQHTGKRLVDIEGLRGSCRVNVSGGKTACFFATLRPNRHHQIHPGAN